jgi:hypothetical protein
MRRKLQALCKPHKIPANETNVFMADALTTLLRGPTNEEASVEEEAPIIATEVECVREVSEGTVTDDASKPVAKQPKEDDGKASCSKENAGEYKHP